MSLDLESVTDPATYVAEPGLKTVSIGELSFETGGYLPEVELAYETWGTLNANKSNAILIQHALTGDTHVASSEALPEAGWWENIIGSGKAIDTDKWFVMAVNMVGGCYGSTGPASLDEKQQAYGSKFPFVTIRDSVNAEAKLANILGIERFHAIIGGSMGGGRALEWAAMYPDRVNGVGVIACGGQSTAEQIAFAQTQVDAIRLDPNFKGGDYYDGPAPVHGLGIARQIAHINYRSEPELNARFGRAFQGNENPLESAVTSRTGRYQVESYLDYKAKDLAGRFDANSYVALTEALMSHDVGRHRGGQAAAVAGITATPFIVAVNSDRLYFPEQSYQLAADFGPHTPVHMIDSPIGHDGFLTDLHQVADAMITTLGL
ncbi:MAG: homoserine O-acetyltransferase [Micrococcaceae bacterium]|nr:homoserine O-acetyltransferase [Micrococcaceae bacterium]